MDNNLTERSGAYWVDSHAHIYAKQFKGDREDTLRRAQELTIEKIVMPNVDHTSIEAMLEVESHYPKMCYATMGLHPCSVNKNFERELYIVEEWLAKRKFTAVGEMGTDLYWDKTFWEQQKEAFSIQVQWAKQYKLPLIIHCRETMDETISMVESLQDGTLTGVFHCFTGTAAQADRIIKLNFHLGIGGVATFKKGGLDTVIPEIPMDRILLETDSPYLAPTPHRGKRNEPGYILLVAEKISAFKEVTIQELKIQTTRNAIQLFQQIA